MLRMLTFLLEINCLQCCHIFPWYLPSFKKKCVAVQTKNVAKNGKFLNNLLSFWVSFSFSAYSFLFIPFGLSLAKGWQFVGGWFLYDTFLCGSLFRWHLSTRPPCQKHPCPSPAPSILQLRRHTLGGMALQGKVGETEEIAQRASGWMPSFQLLLQTFFPNIVCGRKPLLRPPSSQCFPNTPSAVTCHHFLQLHCIPYICNLPNNAGVQIVRNTRGPCSFFFSLSRRAT